ncbi:hypothetical protein [Streptomyces sp. MUM 178J]|uniref:hypothetical protein n=1 Tax=Streptomyces sp. MUM 178J TaxID=2791991 RepID=UPI001F0500C4|nr:hypothetical protein [Streptomyces sp. MUM 178J]WRQ80875.1 hypothetical protein I3F59_016760 [Streptomyces sp. MUM 178J]
MTFAPSRAQVLALLAATVATLLAVTAAVWWGPAAPAGRPGPPQTETPGRASPDEAARLLHDAEELLLRDCMRRAGFDYHPVPSEPPSVEHAFPYVLDDAAWAREHGYGRDLAERRRALTRSDPNRRYFESLTPRRKSQALVAANGPSPRGVLATLPGGGAVQRSDRGCVSEAQRRLYGDLPAWFQASTAVRTLELVRRSRVVADPRYREGVTAWAACMRGAGHPHPTPGRARATALSAADPLPRSREIALALAEVRCAERSGLADTARRLDAHHEALLSRRYRRDTEAKIRLETGALPRARAVVDGRRAAY